MPKFRMLMPPVVVRFRDAAGKLKAPPQSSGASVSQAQTSYGIFFMFSFLLLEPVMKI